MPPAAAAAPADGASAATSAADLAVFPWLAFRDDAVVPAPPAPPADAAHEDDDLCVCCLDAPRDTPLAGCAAAHAPVMCAACVALLLARATPACPLCRAPVA
jgi:hypothetical protein